jgi:hypothetical protein
MRRVVRAIVRVEVVSLHSIFVTILQIWCWGPWVKNSDTPCWTHSTTLGLLRANQGEAWQRVADPAFSEPALARAGKLAFHFVSGFNRPRE